MALLAGVPLFAGVSEASLRRIADVTATIDFPPERAIVLQGQVGNGLYLLVSGRARALQGESVLAEFGPGDFLGELAVIDQQPRTATVVALEPTVCLALASWDLLAVLESDPQLGLNLVHELVRRLRACDEQLRH
jgi:CRP-like cAMP-binding protein